MNKYIIPICDIKSGDIWLHKITARSLKECEDKLMGSLIRIYPKAEIVENEAYIDFISWLDFNLDVLVGEITDIETC